MSDNEKEPVTGKLGLAEEIDNAPGVTVWITNNFAEDWFQDALNEVGGEGGYNARRREIIFSASFAECFIFEWARTKLQVDEVNDFFPTKPRFKDDLRYRRNIKEKWKGVPLDLYEADKILMNPNLNLSKLGELVKYRDGIIHSAGSRPKSIHLKGKDIPFPTKEDLLKKKAGWATTIVSDLVIELCTKLGEPKPPYIEDINNDED